MTLTPAQRRVLQLLRDGRSVQGYRGPLRWHYGAERDGREQRLNVRETDRLLQAGLLNVKEIWGGVRFYLTAKGEELAGRTGREEDHA